MPIVLCEDYRILIDAYKALGQECARSVSTNDVVLGGFRVFGAAGLILTIIDAIAEIAQWAPSQPDCACLISLWHYMGNGTPERDENNPCWGVNQNGQAWAGLLDLVSGGTPGVVADFYIVPDLDEQWGYVVETTGENPPQTLTTLDCPCLVQWWGLLMRQ